MTEKRQTVTFWRLWIEEDNSHNANQLSLPEVPNTTTNQLSLPEGRNITANQRSLPAVQSESQQEEKEIVVVCRLDLYNIISHNIIFFK